MGLRALSLDYSVMSAYEVLFCHWVSPGSQTSIHWPFKKENQIKQYFLKFKTKKGFFIEKECVHIL
ncbi:hypothetical protein Hanom_Chr11g01044451 [Helianthus anomalus]